MSYYDRNNQMSRYNNNYYINNNNYGYGYDSGRRSSGGSFNTKLTAALVLGIVSTAVSVVVGWWFGFIFPVLCLGCGVVGIILAVPCRKRLRQYRLPTGKATAAFVLSIIGTCLSGLGFAAAICISIAQASAEAYLRSLWY